MNTPPTPPPGASPDFPDEDLRARLASLLPPDSIAAALPRAIAAYHELDGRPAAEVAVLFAYQQVVIEGLTTALSNSNSATESKLGLDSKTSAGVIVPQRIKKRF